VYRPVCILSLAVGQPDAVATLVCTASLRFTSMVWIVAVLEGGRHALQVSFFCVPCKPHLFAADKFARLPAAGKLL
jgi:hypothetical protein